MGSIRNPCLLILLFCLLVHNSSANHEKRLPSAMVVGTVYCDTCFHQEFSQTSHFIPGASVAVECTDERQKLSFRNEVKTNERGEFRVHLPFAVGKHIERIKRCSVKLVSSSEPFCAVASMATSSSLHLKSRKQGMHIFSAGFFTFKPLKQPDLCNQKSGPITSSKFSSMKDIFPNPGLPLFPPQNQNPPMTNLPPLPQLPQFPPLPIPSTIPNRLNLNSPNLGTPAKLSSLPKPAEFPNKTPPSDQKNDQPTLFYPSPLIPFLPAPPAFGIPQIPNPFQPVPIMPTNPFQTPPNPFQQPPPLISSPPNPFIAPPSPPAFSPPNPVQPSPPFVNLPSVPFITPFPPPPPIFSFPFLPPNPVFPGIPPSFPSKKKLP